METRLIRKIGAWQTYPTHLRHAAITDHLDDYLELAWAGPNCNVYLGSSTGKQIAVVAYLAGSPIPAHLAGPDIRFGENQSYLLVDTHRPYHLVSAAPLGQHQLRLATRSDKLEYYGISERPQGVTDAQSL